MSAGAEQGLTELIAEFYRTHYREEIAELAQRYPSEQRTLVVDTAEIGRWDPDVRDDVLNDPEQINPYFDDVLGRADLLDGTTLGDASIRFVASDIEPISVADLRSDHLGQLVRISGQVSKATPVRPRVTQPPSSVATAGRSPGSHRDTPNKAKSPTNAAAASGRARSGLRSTRAKWSSTSSCA